MHTILVFLTLVIMTPVFGLMVIVAALFGVQDREGSIYDNAPRWWARCLVWAAGIRVRLHNEERLRSGEPRVRIPVKRVSGSLFSIFTDIPITQGCPASPATAATLPRPLGCGAADSHRQKVHT